MAGAPIGNQNAVKAKRWQQAIDRALAKRSKGDAIQALDELAEKFLNAVEAEGVGGYRELADRIDGKPAQQVQLSGDPDGAPIAQRIEQVIVDADK